MNPALSDAYRYILFLDRYRRGDYDNALLEASQIDLPRDIFSPISLAMAHGALGDQSAAQEAVQRIRAMAPDFGDRAIAELSGEQLRRGHHPRYRAGPGARGPGAEAAGARHAVTGLRFGDHGCACCGNANS